MMSKVVSLIPARSGSKGIRDKNLQSVNGRSLIQRAVDYSRSVSWIDECYVSTDSERYETHALAAGACSLGLRDPKLSNDSARTIDVCKSFLADYKQTNGFAPSLLVLLQPTSPIRPEISRSYIEDFCNCEKASTIIAVSRVDEPHPYKMFIENDGIIEPLFGAEYTGVPRQLLPVCFIVTGSIYIWKVDRLMHSDMNLIDQVQYILQEDFVNIDSEIDLQIARLKS